MTSIKLTNIRTVSGRAVAELLLVHDLSIGVLPRGVAGEQAGNRAFGGSQLLLAAPQSGLKAGQLRLQIRAASGDRALPDVGASRWLYQDQTLGREQPDRGLSCVLSHVMNVPELPVRRHPRAGRIRPVPDLGTQDVRETSARESVRTRRCHSASIATCLKTALDAATVASYCLNTVTTGARQKRSSPVRQPTTVEEW